VKIYTKTGDDGSTGVVSGKRVKKHALVIEAYGTVDELSSFVGWAAASAEATSFAFQLEQIQNDLHVLAADLATPIEVNPKLGRFQVDRAKNLETWMDEWEARLPPLRQFILPGGSELSSRFHICRTVARRAEREVLRFGEEQPVTPGLVVYLNRLSDYFFVSARAANLLAKVDDQLWDQTR